MNTQTLNVRINKDTKKQAQKVFEEMGLDISSAIKLFLNKVIATESIPFAINIKGSMNNPKFIKMIQEETDWALKNGKKYSSVKEMFDDILAR
jgi:DNA-damage-inducible protein J